MRTRILAKTLAAILCVTLVMGVGAKPAKAAWWTVVASIAVSVVQHLAAGGNGLDQAKREIIAAINESRQAILDQIDAIASADVEACTEASLLLFENIDQMDVYTLGTFAVSATNCATLSTSYLNAVAGQRAADAIGKLMGAIYSVAMVAFAKLGFPTTDLLNKLIAGYENLIVKLLPSCADSQYREYDDRGRLVTVENQYNCTAYNGDTGFGYELYYLGRLTTPPLNRAAVQDEATRNTSRAVAQNILPSLRQLRPVM